MLLRIIIASTFFIWLLLLLLGKGGFVHILILISAGVAVVEILRVYRTNLTDDSPPVN